MGELNTEIYNSNKRSRVESGLDSVGDSPDSKRVNTESKLGPTSSELDLVDSQSGSDRHESDVPEAEVDLDSPEAQQLREDILDILDKPDAVTDCPPEIQDLDSVMKSFEEEILHGSDPQTVLDMTPSESGESQPDLGYLLEASDDELGLPPTVSPADGQAYAGASIMPEAAEFGNIVGFEDEMPNYDSFDFGMAAGVTEGDNDGSNSNDFVTVGGLFEYPEPSDFSELSWRQESLPAL